MKTVLEKAVNECIERIKETERFYESDEFNSLIRIIRRHKKIDQDELRYGIKAIKGLPEEKFRRVVETVFHRLDSEFVQDHDAPFPEYHIDYKGIRFHLITGQGSAYWTSRIQ